MLELQLYYLLLSPPWPGVGVGDVVGGVVVSPVGGVLGLLVAVPQLLLLHPPGLGVAGGGGEVVDGVISPLVDGAVLDFPPACFSLPPHPSTSYS